MDIEVAVPKKAIVGEGPIWDPEQQCLYWVDILSHELYIYTPENGENRTLDVGQAVGTVVPRASGGVMLAMHHGFAGLDLDTGQLTPMGDPASDIPTNRFNDGKCGPDGRFWAGTMDFDGKPDCGSLYCLHTDHSITKEITPVTISNGLVWSHDHKTMYYIDTGANVVAAYDYDIETGRIQNRRIAVGNPEQGHLDGMSIDSEGLLWIGQFGGSMVGCYDPITGKLVRSIPLPVTQVTACAFGGPNLDQLYITSACHNLSEADLQAQPLAGSLLKIEIGVRGVPAFAYAG